MSTALEIQSAGDGTAEDDAKGGVRRWPRLRASLDAGVRAGTVGACIGVVVSVLEQVAIGIWGGSGGPAPAPDTTVADRLLGVALTASSFGVSALLFGALGYLVGSTAGPRAARVGKLTAATLAILVVTLFHAFALGLRLLLGSSLTVSGVQFFLNSTEHMLSAITTQYLGYLGAVVFASLVIAALVCLTVRRVSRAPLTVRRVEMLNGFGMTTVALVAVAAPLPVALVRGAAKTCPEVALLASVGGSRRAERFTGEAFGVLTGAALDAPKRAELGPWGAAAATNDEEDGERPNVVVITLETVGANHVGFMGYPRKATPNLDRIAKDSLILQRAYTTATHSNYAQMSVISALFPRRGSALDMYQRLDYPRFLLHDVTHGLGYSTATVSSQDENWQGMLRFQTSTAPTYFRHAPDYAGERLDMHTEEIAPDDTTVTQAIEWIDKIDGEPFSLYVNLQSTHFPYPLPTYASRPFQPSEPKGTFNYVQWDQSELPTIINRYDNALHFVDQQVGRLFDALAERDMLDDTIFVVTADHGENFFDNDMVTHGRSLLEEEARVPFIVHYPRVLEPRRVDVAVSTLDVLPTVIDLMGHGTHPGLQGESVASAGLPGFDRTSAVFMNIQGWKHYDGIVCMPYKLIFDPDTEESALYHLVQDPKETQDIAKQRPDVVLALETTLLAQIDAQERYHADDDEGHALREDRFAPFMLPCPVLDGASPVPAP